jgi:hypothetical protein
MPAPPRRSRKWLIWLGVAAGVALFVGANAHLVYVSFTSQPDCVAHAKTAGAGGAPMRAAKSAC